MRIKNIVIVFALFVIGILAVDKKCLAYTLSCSTSYHSINTNNVDSVSNTAYFRVGDTVYSNAAIDTQSDIMKYYYARIEKNGAVIYSSSENYTYGIRWFSWGHVFNSPGEYVFKFEERDQNGTSLGVQSTFYVRDSIPKIQSSPSSRTVKAGNATVFSVSATGTNLKYQWGYNYTGDTNRWYEISGATSSSYTILANAMTGSCDGRYYFCRVSNYGNDSVFSIPAKLNIKYDVIYDANGGSGAPSAQSKYHGSTLTLRSAKPTRTGYIFKGWSTSSTATKASYQPGDNYTSNSDATLYAVWERIQYNISYNANGGSGAPSAQSKYHGSTLTLRSAKPTRTGYIFKGWSTSSTATKASYQPGDNYTSNSNVTLYAVWEKIQYNITYDANGGSGAPSDQSKYYDSTITLRSGKPTREGYIFKGWSTRSTALSADYQPGASYSSNSNLTLYAVWEQIKCYVYYNANGGSGAPFEQWKYYDSTLVLRSGTPIRVGYTFKGWSTSSTATSVSYMPGGTYTANRDMTLYAVWKAMPTVTPTPRPGSSINQGTQVTSQPSSLSSGTGLYTPASAGNNKKKAAKLKIGSIVVKNSLVCKVTSLTGKKGKLKVIRLNSNKLKKVIIPQKIKMNGVNFAVTVIGKNVFNKKCKRLKVIFIKSTKLSKFEKNKISKKCKIIVPKSKVKKYTKLVKKGR